MKENILESIGHTPLVKIRRLNPNPRVTIAAKLEGTNPGGSVKDRIALYMITAAERKGELTKDKIILEPTSGNTGIGLAMIAAVKGYRMLVTMSEWMSEERRKMLEAFGAEIILTPGEKGTDGAIEKAHELYAKNPELYFMPNQYDNPSNVLAHYETTAIEIWEQTKGKITHFVAGMGTTGTLMGCSRRLKEFNPDIKIIGVEPFKHHKIQGLKNMKEAIVPKIYNPALLDEKINVADEDAFAMTRRLAREEGIFCGMSSGAAFHVAVELAKKLNEGLIVTLFPDRGEKYLSTPLYLPEPL
ncbi:MAG TPA: cysteine synthase A [Syntrophomonadaceae bacterium]|nr:cysteine synthase A [Syntrophomonadaceae bacterium]